jgi:hypothetical protein
MAPDDRKKTPRSGLDAPIPSHRGLGTMTPHAPSRKVRASNDGGAMPPEHPYIHKIAQYL